MKYRIVALPVLCLSSAFFTPVHALPTEEALQGVITLCAGGRSIEVKGNLNASLKKWLTTASADGGGSLDDMGAIIKQTKDDKIRVEALSVYHDCAKGIIQMYLQEDAKIREAEAAKEDAKIREAEAKADQSNLTDVKLGVIGDDATVRQVGNASGPGENKTKVEIESVGKGSTIEGVGNASSSN